MKKNPPESSSCVSLRIASYNILNTKDRWSERSSLCLSAITQMSSDILGLQETVFGPKQLDLIESYNKYLCPVQIDIFKYNRHPDPQAQIDGNAILVRNDLDGFIVLDHKILHLSAVRAAQCLTLAVKDSPNKKIHIVNTHLHHTIEDHSTRDKQIHEIIYWLEHTIGSDKDIYIIMGDLNATPDSDTYQSLINTQYTSLYHHIHQKEPSLTFPTGLQAQYMDTDPPGCFDYIFLKDLSGDTQIITSQLAGERGIQADNLYPSDHFSIYADLLFNY